MNKDLYEDTDREQLIELVNYYKSECVNLGRYWYEEINANKSIKNENKMLKKRIEEYKNKINELIERKGYL